MKIERFEVTLDKGSDETYYAGQTVLGQIEVHAKRKVAIGRLHVSITGTIETGWRVKRKKKEEFFESRSSCLQESIDLTTTIADHCNDDFRLHEGQHSIPFEMKLPLDVISSMVRENLGTIRYICTAVLDVPEGGGNQFIAEKELKVYSLLNLDAPHLREAATASEEEEVTGCCGVRIGKLLATMKVHEAGLLPGETTRITLTIENRARKKRLIFPRLWRGRRRNEHECVLISLCQQTDFVSASRSNPGHLDRRSITLVLQSHGTCRALPGNGPEMKDIEFAVPNDLPPTSVQADGLITVSYFFKMDLEDFDVIVPVVVGSLKSTGEIP